MTRFLTAVAAGACLTAGACNNASTTGSTKPVDKPAVADIGPPLLPAAKMPELPRPTAAADPIVIPNAVVQFDVKVQIPAQVDGLIELP